MRPLRINIKIMEKTKNNLAVYKSDAIQRKIYTIRDNQVMLDSDLAVFYGVETKVLNQAVKRNKGRFPVDFMFQLNEGEWDSLRYQNGTLNGESLRSQNVTLKEERGRHRKYNPYVFTEQGVAMLSGVLKSKTAVKMSIQIISAFVAMRKFLTANAGVFQRLDTLEFKQLESDKKLEELLNELEKNELNPKQGIFFDGQIFDAHKFVSDLVRKAKKSIVLIDNYVDDTVLDLFSKRKKNVSVTIYTANLPKALITDLKKFNIQYPQIEIEEFKNSHDRFMIIDNEDVYHFGASLKDLGKKWFAFSKFDKDALKILDKLNDK